MGRTTVRQHLRRKPKGGYTTVRRHTRRTRGKQKIPKIPRNVRIIQQKPPTSAFSRGKAIDEIANSIAEGFLEGAIVYGISYAFPPLGAFLLPTYDALKLSFTLINASQQIITARQNNRKRIASRTTPRVAGELTSFIASKGSYAVASSIVDNSIRKLGLQNNVGAEILKGTLSNGLSEGAGGLASYTVGTIVGV